MFLPLAALSLSTQLVIAVADEVPTFDVRPSCYAASLDLSNANRRDMDACLKSENRALDDLKQQWSEFTAAEKSRCTEKATMAGNPSYADLVTCLEMDRDVRDLRTQPRSMTGQGTR